jgi:hypothetical protein
MSELARLLQQYGYGEQPNPLAQDGVTYDTSNVLAGMPRPNALADALRTAASSIPENKSLPEPAFPFDPRSMSMLNMVRGGLGTAANWLEGRPEIGKDTLAPLGAGLMGSAFAPQNALGIFGGRLAKTADHNALAKAEELAAKGADRKAIWDQTGWFQGADGKWRFEIPDNQATLLRSGDTYEKQWRSYADPHDEYPAVAELMRHDALSAAYPGAMRTDLKLLPKHAGEDTTGWFHQGDIALNKSLPAEEIKPTLLHEIQHYIQKQEGFDPGTNPTFEAKNATPTNQIIKQMRADFAKKAFESPEFVGSKAAADEWDRILRLERAEKEMIGHQRYDASIGEMESRNVEKRMLMTPQERRARPPWETE